MGKNIYVSAEQLYYDSLELSKKIFDSGFKPTFLVGIWRGGTPPGILVQEYLAYNNIKTDHISIRTSGYDENDLPLKEIRVYGLDYIIKNATPNDTLLIIDDVWDRGLSIIAVEKKLIEGMGDNAPKNIKVATIYYKPEKNLTDKEPDFYIKKAEKDEWIYFPHEFKGLTRDEILKNKGPGMEKFF